MKMKDDFKKGIQDLRKVGMTPNERSGLSVRLTEYVRNNPLKIISPWYSKAEFKFIYVLALVVFIIGGGAAYSAQSSLPGDKLYPLKVDLIEPLQYTMAVGTVAKANVEAEHIETRLQEAEELDLKGKLSTSSKEELEQSLENHTDSFVHLVKDTPDVSTSTDEAINTVVNLQSNIKAHSHILNKLQIATTTIASKNNKNRNRKNKNSEDKGNFAPQTMSVSATATTEATSTSITDQDQNDENGDQEDRITNRTNDLLKFLKDRSSHSHRQESENNND